MAPEEEEEEKEKLLLLLKRPDFPSFLFVAFFFSPAIAATADRLSDCSSLAAFSAVAALGAELFFFAKSSAEKQLLCLLLLLLSAFSECLGATVAAAAAGH